MKKYILNKDNFDSIISQFNAGDQIYLTANVLTVRDGTCKMLLNENKQYESLLNGGILYFCGPSPAPNGKIIGSCGPTTTSRMQFYFENFLKLGVRAFIGKGLIAQEYAGLFSRFNACLFSATGGIGAFLANKVTNSKIIAFSEYGPEAVRELKIKDFPLVVSIDSRGKIM